MNVGLYLTLYYYISLLREQRTSAENYNLNSLYLKRFLFRI